MSDQNWIIVSYEKTKQNAMHEARKRRKSGEKVRARFIGEQWVVEIRSYAYND